MKLIYLMVNNFLRFSNTLSYVWITRLLVDLRNSESLKTNHFVCICQTFQTKIIQKINIYLDLRILDCDVSKTSSNYACCAILSLTHFGIYFGGSLHFLKVRYYCKNSWNWLIMILFLFHEFVWPAGFINFHPGMNLFLNILQPDMILARIPWIW